MPTLNWIGKDAVVTHHQDVPYRLLEPVAELSCRPSPTGANSARSRANGSRADERPNETREGWGGAGGEGSESADNPNGNLIVQ
ncbi:hypothetical protein B1B_11927, partial [mine drainage metagenome]